MTSQDYDNKKDKTPKVEKSRKTAETYEPSSIQLRVSCNSWSHEQEPLKFFISLRNICVPSLFLKFSYFLTYLSQKFPNLSFPSSYWPHSNFKKV